MRGVSVRILVLLLLTLAAPQPSRGFDSANMDTSINPCADFYQYAVGGWEKRTTIPAEYGKYGVDQEVEGRTFAIVKSILEGAAAVCWTEWPEVTTSSDAMPSRWALSNATTPSVSC